MIRDCLHRRLLGVGWFPQHSPIYVSELGVPTLTAVFHARLYGMFIEIQRNLRRRTLHRMNQGSNFLGGSFSNNDNVRAPIQFRRQGRQPQLLKRWFFPKTKLTHFHINSTSVIKTVKQNKISFSSIKINKPFPASAQCLVDQLQVQKPIVVVATDQMPDHTQSRK